MNVNPLLQYKVIEAAQHISIVPREANVPGANNLIIANMPTCCEYLARYTEARGNGKEIKAAHEIALRGANIISNVGAKH